MNVKNYRGKTTEECFRQIKAEMGGTAVILQSRTIKPIFGKFGKPTFEVVAVNDSDGSVEKLLSQTKKSAPVEPEEPEYEPKAPPITTKEWVSARPKTSLADLAELMERKSTPPPIAVRPPIVDVSDDRFSRIEKQIEMLAQTVEQVATLKADAIEKGAIVETRIKQRTETTDKPGFFRYKLPVEEVAAPSLPVTSKKREQKTEHSYSAQMDKLRKSGIAEPLIRRILSEMPGGLSQSDATLFLQDLLSSWFQVGGVLKSSSRKTQAVALIGPTGVGKSTTIAKLAAQLTLKENVSVGIITLDTERVGASRQMLNYGEILQVPVKVAKDAVELASHIQSFEATGTKMVLIDTPGRSPADALPLAEMSASLRGVVDLVSMLVLPATMSSANFDNVVARFSKVAAPQAVILSKLDETVDTQCLGFLMNMQARTKLPLAYVTTGSRVPDDILTADAHTLVNKLVS